MKKYKIELSDFEEMIFSEAFIHLIQTSKSHSEEAKKLYLKLIKQMGYKPTPFHKKLKYEEDTRIC